MVNGYNYLSIVRPKGEISTYFEIHIWSLITDKTLEVISNLNN